MTTKTLSELEEIYTEAEQVDREVFAEMKSNVLLLSGEFYRKNRDTNSGHVRQPDRDPNRLKLRLVKNHTHKVVRHYEAGLAGIDPVIGPQDEKSMQDQKSAELNQAVWDFIAEKDRMAEKIRKWRRDFIGVGEVCVLIRWDPLKGRFLGYQQAVDEDGEPVFEMTGEVDPMTGEPVMEAVPDEDQPVFSGGFAFESIFAANLLRHAGCDTMRESPCWIVRKMARIKDLKVRYAGDEEKLKYIQESADDEYVVFDSNASSYERKKGQTLVKEYYYQPCAEYPEGYYFITTEHGILEQGPLPYGVFSICWAGFDEFPTTPRCRSIIKVARPYISEISRASSQAALHQITIGDDKIIYQKGTKLEPGSLLPGVRGITFQGREPKILPGREGSQFGPYIEAQIRELYSVLMLDEINEENMNQYDPLMLLYRAAAHRRKFSGYIERFQQFLIDVVSVTLDLAKHYLPDDELIPAVGNSEFINIEEFRNTDPQCYQIKIETKDEALDQLIGRQLTFQNILQYVGKSLSQDQIGRLMKNMGWGNWEEAFDDFTIDSDSAQNVMLALERGQEPILSPYDNAADMTKRLTARMRKQDFEFLPPEIKQAYGAVKDYYEQKIEDEKAKLEAARNEFIPVDGPMVAVDMYVEDPQNPENQPKRWRVPQRALEWLKQHMDAQGATLGKLEQMEDAVLAEIAGRFANGGAMGPGQVPMGYPPQGTAFPN